MKQRWRSIMRPDGPDPMDSPTAGEAFGVWVLGVLWALACMWLGYLGPHWVLPGVLVAGLLAIWGWRHIEWLWWFPVVLVMATMLEPLSPLTLRSRFGPLVYIDLLTLGVVAVAMVRAIWLRMPLLPRTPVDPLISAIFALFALSLFSPGASDSLIHDVRLFTVRVVVFYATATIASRPFGSRWVWIAFPLATALIGIHSICARWLGPDVLTIQSHYADRVWGSNHGILRTLLIALPVSLGLSLNAGRMPARVLWMFASISGTAGLTLHLAATDALPLAPFGTTAWTPFLVIRALLTCVTLATLTWLSMKVLSHRRHEAPRWIAMGVVFVGFAFLHVWAPALSGPSVPLLSVSAGLVVGTLRADRRALRSGREIIPVERKAA